MSRSPTEPPWWGFFMPEMGYTPVMGDGEMPKERIYGTPLEGEQYDLLVQWGKAENYHVRDDDGYDGRLFVAAVKQSSDDAPVWVHLDRTAANRLIAAARRGRDQAFGRDE